MAAAITVAVMACLLALCMFVWACAEQDAKERETKRADNAEQSWLRELILRVNAEQSRDNARGACDDEREAAAWDALREADRDIRAAAIAHDEAKHLDRDWLDLDMSEGER